MSLRKREEIQEVLRGIENNPQQNYKPHRPLRTAGIQFSTTENKNANIDKAIKIANVAVEKKVKVLAFSELFTLPWFDVANKQSYLEYAESIPGPSTEPFIELADQNGMVFLCPVLELDSGKYFNSAAVIGPDGLIGTYRKTQVPDIPYWEERQLFASGALEYPVFNTDFGRIGIQIGWDTFFPEAFRILALKGAEIIFVPTAAALESQDRWQNVITAQAVMNNLFVFRINRVGKTGILNFYGRSSCVDPFGEYPAEPVFHKDALVIADIDLDMVQQAREEFPFLNELRSGYYDDLI